MKEIRKRRKSLTNYEEDQQSYLENYQGMRQHGAHADMDVYSESDGYFGSISQFYGDLPEEQVDTEAIDKEFAARYDKLFKVAKRALTAQQYLIFDMYFVKCFSQDKVARTLHVTRPYIVKACDRILEILRMFESEVTE